MHIIHTQTQERDMFKVKLTAIWFPYARMKNNYNYENKQTINSIEKSMANY